MNRQGSSQQPNLAPGLTHAAPSGDSAPHAPARHPSGLTAEAFSEPDDAAAVLRRRLHSCRSDLRLLSNTRRLLRQRICRSADTLSSVCARNAASRPAPHPQPLDTEPVSPEAGSLTPCVQRRMLAAAAPRPPPGLSHYEAHCGIDIESLLRVKAAAPGAAQGHLETNLRVDLHEYCERVSVSTGVSKDNICWHMILSWDLAPAKPMSFSLCFGTAACVASWIVFYTLCQLESAFLLEEGSMLAVSNESMSIPEMSGPSQTSTAHPAEDGVAPRPQPRASNSSGVVAAGCAAATAAAFDDSGAPHGAEVAEMGEPRRRGPADVGDMHTTVGPSGGTPGGPAGGPREPTRAGRSEGEAGSPREEFGESIGSHGGSGEDREGDGVRWFAGMLSDDADSGGSGEVRLRCGLASSLPLLPAVRSEVEALVGRFHARLPRRMVEVALELMLKRCVASGEPFGDDNSAEAGVEAVEGAEEAGLQPRHLQPHHLQGVLAATGAMQEALAHALQGIRQEAAPQWSVSREVHAVDMHVMDRRWQGFTLGLIGLTACCTEDFFRLALVLALAGTSQSSHTERMQMRLYSNLRMPPSQRRIMAKVWTDWTRERGMLSLSLNEALLPVSVWSLHLNSMPRSVSAVAAAVSAGGATLRLQALPGGARLPHTPAVGFFAPAMHSWGGRDTAETLPQRRFFSESGRLLLDSPAAWVMSKDLVAAAPGLIGQCTVATLAAAETLRRLHAVHDASMLMYQDLQARVVSKEYLSVTQVMQLAWLPVQHCVGCPDRLALCRQAHAQLRRDGLFEKIGAIAL